MLRELTGEVGADGFDEGAAGTGRQLSDVVVDALVLVAGVGEDRTERPARLDGTQVDGGAVLATGDIYEVLNIAFSHRPAPTCRPEPSMLSSQKMMEVYR